MMQIKIATYIALSRPEHQSTDRVELAAMYFLRFCAYFTFALGDPLLMQVIVLLFTTNHQLILEIVSLATCAYAFVSQCLSSTISQLMLTAHSRLFIFMHHLLFIIITLLILKVKSYDQNSLVSTSTSTSTSVMILRPSLMISNQDVIQF